MASAPEPPGWRQAPAVAAGWRPVVTAFVQGRDGRVLVVRRSDKVSTYRGLWGGVSGGLETTDASLVARALAEVEEEAGIPPSALRLAARGRPLPVRDGGRKFLVYPFLFTAVASEAEAQAPAGGGDGGAGPAESAGGAPEGSRAGGGGGGPTAAVALDPAAAAAVGVDAVAAADPPVTLNWENWEARWVTQEELPRLPQVPLLTETLGRLVLPPHMARHVEYLLADRAHGAAQLAAYTVQAFEDVATFEQQQRSAGCEERSGQAVLDSYRDFGFHLGCARPSMAAIANAAADVLTALDALLQSTAAGNSSGSQQGQPTAQAVRAALLEAARSEAARMQARSAALRDAATALLTRRPGARVLTLSYSSTLLAALSAAAPSLGAVVCCESRPLCEGVALARALAAAGVRGVSVITDAQAGAFVGGVDLVLLGADELGASGAVNKVGSRLVALAAREAGVPVHVCADTGKLGGGAPVSALVELPRSGGAGGSSGTAAAEAEGRRQEAGAGASGGGSGGEEGEEKGPEEVTQGWPLALQHGSSSTAMADAAGAAAGDDGGGGGVAVRNIYFEAVPPALLTGGVVTERGVLQQDDIRSASEARRAQYLAAFGLATLEHPPPAEA